MFECLNKYKVSPKKYYINISHAKMHKQLCKQCNQTLNCFFFSVMLFRGNSEKVLLN